jgi:hypothetical protein
MRRHCNGWISVSKDASISRSAAEHALLKASIASKVCIFTSNFDVTVALQ